jgi:hypothetical protein
VTSLISDELLRSLMAVGDVDVLVGLPTLNHSATAAVPVRAAHVAFHQQLARERAVFVNVDGGSSDGTPDVVREASILERETVLASHSLRTRHRISAPYHGVPGKASALRTLFAAADLLNARVVVVLDPEVTSVTPESIAALARPVLAGEAQYVSPAYARHPLDGPLVTQVVRPLFRAAYGVRLREPLAGELACSEEFAATCLERREWDSDTLRAGVDLWLSTVAVSGFRVAEVRLPPRQLAVHARPGVASIVPQVLEALLACLRVDEGAWTRTTAVRDVPAFGGESPMPEPASVADSEAFAASFREGVSALEPILRPALSPATLDGLRAAASGPRPRLSDALWIATVCEIASAHRAAALSREHLMQASVPLYLGRVSSFLAEHADAPAQSIESRLEALCLEFERFKPTLVELWTAAMR